MSALSSEEWRILPFSNRDAGPPILLFKFITASDGFALYITDLVHCWMDSRDRASITKEAARCPTSIDPSEDAGQFGVLLSKLRDGLTGTQGGRCKIGSMYRDSQESMSSWGFTLLTKTPLPPPLQPLLWTFNLFQEGRTLLTRELLLPALASELKYRMQVEELRSNIEEKDHVITRLMDKIEQSSMDLSLVFPGYSSGRKGLNAQNAIKVVPGLSRFDAVGWQKAHANDQLATIQTLVEAITKPGSHQLSYEGPQDPFDGASAWELFGKVGGWREDWISPEDHDSTFTPDGEPTNRKLDGEPAVPKLPIEESANAFEDISPANIDTENRSTPFFPRQRPSSTSRRSYSTSSDYSPPPPTKIKPAMADNVGESRSKVPRVSPSPVSSHLDSATSSGSESDSPRLQKKLKKSSNLGAPNKASQPSTFRPSPSPLPAASNHSTRPRKLGALGGKKDRLRHSSSPVPLHSYAETKTETPQHTTSRKLGVLGGRHKLAAPQKAEVASESASQHPINNDDLDATDSPSPPSQPSVAPPSHSTTTRKEAAAKASVGPEDEPATAEEIADRKREELKRTLDAGGGKKKKRKF